MLRPAHPSVHGIRTLQLKKPSFVPRSRYVKQYRTRAAPEEAWAFEGQSAPTPLKWLPFLNERAAVKESLRELDGAEKLASGGILAAVEFGHWLTFLPCFILAYSLILHQEAVYHHLQGISATLDAYMPARLFLLVLATLLQVFSALPAFVVHEFEGWQLAAFRTYGPSEFSSGLTPLDFLKANNSAWLRQALYRVLFFLQGCGLMAFNFAVVGLMSLDFTNVQHFWSWTTVQALYVLLSAVSFVVCLFGSKAADPVITKLLNLPLPRSVAVHFVMHVLVYLAAVGQLLGAPLLSAAFPALCHIWYVMPFVAMAPLFMLGGKCLQPGVYGAAKPGALIWLAAAVLAATLAAAPWWLEYLGFNSLLAWWNAALLLMFGGVIEGAYAEAAADQALHGLAVIWLLSGVSALIYWMYKVVFV